MNQSSVCILKPQNIKINKPDTNAVQYEIKDNVLVRNNFKCQK